MFWSTSNHSWAVGEKHSLRILPIRLEIVATTYCSTRFKTHVFSLHSHQCIYVSMYLCTNICIYLYSYWSTDPISGLVAGSALEKFEFRQKVIIGGTQRYTRWPWLSEFGYTLGGCNWARLVMHFWGQNYVNLKAMIKRVEGHNLVKLEMHSDAANEQHWRCTWRFWLSMIGWVLRDNWWVVQ
jgi:hypothetical protein